MERLARRESPRRIFEDGVRWVEAINHCEADAREFACWALLSSAHLDAFLQAWTIWHDLRTLSRTQREQIEHLARDQKE